MINEFIYHVCLASLCSSFFVGSLIISRQQLLKHIGASWYYYLWFSIFIPWAAVWIPFKISTNIDSSIGMNYLSTEINTQINNLTIQSKLSVIYIFLTIWLIGVALSSIYFLFIHLKYIYLLRKNSISITDYQQEIINTAIVNKKLMPISGVYISTIVSSPMVCHPFSPKIYLPVNFFKNYTPSEQRHVLQHECIHYQRCDLIANAAMLILLCMNWFNPLILYSYRYFRFAQELSCDAVLVLKLSAADKKSYGYALMKSVFDNTTHRAGVECWWNDGAQLKERCIMLKSHTSSPTMNFLGMISLFSITTISFAAPGIAIYDSSLDLKFSNSTKYNLTFSINGSCSNEIGVINRRSIQIIKHDYLNNACDKNLSLCEIQVYPTDNCSGSKIATIVMDFSGARSIELHSDKYNISSNGKFDLFLGGPWM